MIVSNTIYYDSLDFDKYLQTEGTSFSSIKGFEGTPTAGMQLGTRVHNYISEPEKYDWQQVEEVKAIAGAIRGFVGGAFKYAKKEISFTSDFTFQGLTMKYKGRADALIKGQLIIDYKVLSGSLENACNLFRYPEQISGYCLAAGCEKGLIIAYNKRLKKIETKLITPSTDFWEYNIVRFGKSVTNAITN